MTVTEQESINRTRQVLRKMEDAILAENLSVRARVWCVLSAMRGPDKTCEYSKKNTTAVIRQLAFPRLFADTSSESLVPLLCVGDDTQEAAKYRLAMASPWARGDHFVEHLLNAFRDLGLDPFAVNFPPTATTTNEVPTCTKTT